MSYDPTKVTRLHNGFKVHYAGTTAEGDYVFQTTHDARGKKINSIFLHTYSKHSGQRLDVGFSPANMSWDLKLPYVPKVGDKVTARISSGFATQEYDATVIFVGPCITDTEEDDEEETDYDCTIAWEDKCHNRTVVQAYHSKFLTPK